MARIAQNGLKRFIFIVVPLLRIENIKKIWKKEIYSKYKKMYVS